MRTIAALVAVWYLVAIVGLDVHHDAHGNHTYVVSLLVGTSCDRIHPEVECACHCCHDHEEHHHDCCAGEDLQDLHIDHCCTNEVEVVSLAGEDRQPLVLAQFVALYSTVLLPEPELLFSDRTGRQTSRVIPPGRGILSRNCVLRV